MNSINIKNISKRYGKFNALDDFSCSFKANSINGLLGRNGAGKTTLLDIFGNRKFASSGEILINNKKLENNDVLLEKIFYSTEQIVGLKEIKVKKIIKEVALYENNFDMDYCNNLLDMFEVNTKKTFAKLSSGYKTILLDILNLSSNAEIMIFDEPVSGMDVNHRDMFYKLLIQKQEELNNTIIVSTHLMEEISKIIEYIVIINRGKNIFEDFSEKIINKTFAIEGADENIEKIKDNFQIIGIDKNKIFVMDDNPHNKISNPEKFTITSLSFQDAFIKLTKEGKNYE